DGARYIAAAVQAGARVIAGEGERPGDLAADITYVRVADARAAAAAAASRFYPRQPDTIVAVTGTSGKSSVAEFYRQIVAAMGFEAAAIGTLGVTTSAGTAYGSLTTPDPVSLHAALSDLAGKGVTHLAMEASSHGIDQRRLDGVRLSAAAFTNIGRDHLDYHKSEDAYIDAKLKLFTTLLPQSGTAVLNADGAHVERFAATCRERGLKTLTTGRTGETLRLVSLAVRGFTQNLVVAAGTRQFPIPFPLPGAFQVENALVAAGLAVATLPFHEARQILSQLAFLKGVKGRLERVGEINGALCIVDYAHKPDGLVQVLETLRPFVSGRLICVFGCGGDRDRGKRPIMGDIATRKADIVIVTDDNPRSEDPAAIRSEILAGAPGAEEIGDRREAIFSAVKRLQPGDILVVAGKGHETGQIVGDTVLPFSDDEEILKAIKEFSP
ncbi:MAG: UDP-N-acetylmuramoyl-L-alanyl-D-glutamate--2,6-diaminopimelate ligase, partial [Methylobacteriaceae bacterium]|nr:UDP-N-acetylmuramoyl-L-alanyl-D-glutamate--2,6-diaminopimelate ligase [Methylobacteriaceae bacterium]